MTRDNSSAKPNARSSRSWVWLAGSIAVWFAIFDFGAARFLLNDTSWRVQHHFYHHGLQASSQITDRWGPLTTEIFTNNLGMKDASIRQVPRNFDGYRILAIGDSFTEGQGYRYQDTFSGVFQARALNDKLNIEVLNAGVASHSPRLYYLHLKYILEVAKLKVDEIWTFIDISDAQDEIFYRWFRPAPRDDAADFEQSASAFLSRNSYLYSQHLSVASKELLKAFLRDLYDIGRRIGVTSPSQKEPSDAYESIRLPKDGDQIASRLQEEFALVDSRRPWAQPQFWPKGGFMGERYGWYDDAELRRRWADDGLKLAEGYMLELVALARKHNIPVSIAIYPAASAIGKNTERYESDWRRFAEANGIPFLNLFDTFRELRTAEDDAQAGHFIPGDVHFNDRGHREVGEAWLAFWCREGRGKSLCLPVHK